MALFEPAAADARRTCARCNTELSPLALACPACSALVHGTRLRELADLAAASASTGDRSTARQCWQDALALVPAHSNQHRLINERISALAEPLADVTPSPDPDGTGTRQWWKQGLGAVGALALLLVGKVKFLLLGLTKLSTLASMFGFAAVYWSIFGWPLAVGLVASIYVHEMGHVAMLRHLGIRSGAPLFIPGVGALVMLKERITDPVTDARIGLAGPVWGLGAAVAAWVVYLAGGGPIWLAIAELTGLINLFNLTPVWQLDGSRAIGITLLLTGQRLLWLVGAVAAYRAVKSDSGPGHRHTLYTFAGLVVALAWFARRVQ